MKYLKHILFSFLLLFSGFVFSQNKLITSGSNFISVGDNLISIPFNQYSLNFGGVDESINIDGVLTALASTTMGTWSCWVKPVDATPSEIERLISFGDTDGNEWFDLAITTPGKIRGFLRIAGTSRWVIESDASVFTDNIWTHIALVGIEPVLYADGVAVAQTFIISGDKTKWFFDATGLDNGRISELSSFGGTTGHLNGNIDEVSLWKRALSQSEINEIYNNGIPKNLLFHSAAIDLVAWFRMGDGDTFSTDWTLTDKSINNNTGTSVNMEFLDRTHAKP